MMKRISPWLATVIILVLAGVACSRTFGPSNPSTTGTTQPPIEKHLSGFRQIEGTEYMIADISASPEASGRGDFSPFRWIESGYSGYSGYEIFNYVFFSSKTESFIRLLPTNDQVVLQIIGFPYQTATDKPEDFKPVMWWLFVIARDDTDGNGRLTYGDKLTMGISDVGGNGFTEIIPDADSLLGNVLKNDDTLFVIYHSADKNSIAKIDLPSRKVVSTTEMSLGDDVK